jgi:hypothetical protein
MSGMNADICDILAEYSNNRLSQLISNIAFRYGYITNCKTYNTIIVGNYEYIYIDNKLLIKYKSQIISADRRTYISPKLSYILMDNLSYIKYKPDNINSYKMRINLKK